MSEQNGVGTAAMDGTIRMVLTRIILSCTSGKCLSWACLDCPPERTYDSEDDGVELHPITCGMWYTQDTRYCQRSHIIAPTKTATSTHAFQADGTDFQGKRFSAKWEAGL